MDAWSMIVKRLERCSSAANLTLDEEARTAVADFDRSGRAEAEAVWAELAAVPGVVATRNGLSLTFAA